MKTSEKLTFTKNTLRIPILFVSLIWIIYWVEIQFGLNFNKLGVFPRTFSGLKGVFFTHFIHSNVNHLFNNTVPLFVLLTSLFYFYQKVAFKVLVLGAFFTGFLTWIFARDAFHIGASGIVYLLFSFVFFSGIIKKYYRLIALSMVVIFVYGSMIWYVLPIKEGMSWEGHLSGFLTGLFFALFYRKEGLVKKEYPFIDTEFDSFFDENGNLIENSDENV